MLVGTLFGPDSGGGVVVFKRVVILNIKFLLKNKVFELFVPYLLEYELSAERMLQGFPLVVE